MEVPVATSIIRGIIVRPIEGVAMTIVTSKEGENIPRTTTSVTEGAIVTSLKGTSARSFNIAWFSPDPPLQ